jgi:hypothetical protein
MDRSTWFAFDMRFLRGVRSALGVPDRDDHVGLCRRCAPAISQEWINNSPKPSVGFRDPTQPEAASSSLYIHNNDNRKNAERKILCK